MARRRSIYDTGTYQTPLADFLDQIPDYFIKWEQLKLQEKKYANEQAYREAKDREATRKYANEQGYRAARDKESDRRWDKTQENQAYQRSFDAAKLQLSDELKQISMAPIKQQDALLEKIKPTYTEHPELTGIIDSRISANDAVEGVADRHSDIQSKISDYKVLGKSGRFGSYYDMLEDRQELSKLGKEVQGTSYQSLIDADIAKLDGWLEFSKQNSDKPMPKNLWKYELDRTNYNQTAQQRSADMKAADALSGEIATAKSNLITIEGDTESVAYRSALDAINKKQAQLINLVGGADVDGNEIKGRIAESNATLYGIEQNNKWNPLGGTTKVLEGGVFGYEPKTEMKEQDVEKFILNNPEEGFDTWMEFIANPSEDSENKLKSLMDDYSEAQKRDITGADPDFRGYPKPPEGGGDAERLAAEKAEAAEKAAADKAAADKAAAEKSAKEWAAAKAAEEAGEAGEATEAEAAAKSASLVAAKTRKSYDVKDINTVKDYRKNPRTGRRYAKKIKKLDTLINELNIAKTPFRKKQVQKGVEKISKELQDAYGNYIDPNTGEFTDNKFNKDFYSYLSIYSDLSETQLKEIFKRISTAKPIKSIA